MTVDEGTQGKYIVNTAVVDGPGSEPDIDISDPGVTVDPGNPAPWSQKSADKTSVNVGEVITYTVQVGNGRNATAPWKDITMTDTLPDGVQVVGGMSIDGDPLAFTTNGNVLTAKIGNLGIGETSTIKYQVLVLPEAAGKSLKNSVAFSGKDGTNSSGGSTSTTVPKDDNGGSGVTPNPNPEDDISVVKDVDKTVINLSGNSEDKQAEYTITIKNTSASKATWTDVVFTDVLDYSYVSLLSDTIYVDGTRLSSNQFIYQDQTLKIELGDIPAGKQKTVRFSVQFRNDASGKNYQNRALASGKMNGENKYMLATAPIVQISNGKDVSGIHYAFFHGTDAENDNKWMPYRNIYTEELAITAYRILTNDYQNLLQKNQTVTVPSYVNMYSIEAQFMVGAGVIPPKAFSTDGLTEGVDYVIVGRVKKQIFATRDQIGFVLQKLFGSNYGISGSGFMTRLDYAKLLCMIQGRDLNPNYTYAVNQGKVLDRFPDDAGNPIIIEVSNTHDYMLDSHGNETWVENNTLK